jgi:hypothetical protein
MAASELLAIGSTAAASGDVTVASGDQLTVCLKDAAGPNVGAVRVDLQLKDDAGQYFTVTTLTSAKPAMVIVGAGVYRFSRVAGTCGVFSG